jgi:hypothetical protein
MKFHKKAKTVRVGAGCGIQVVVIIMSARGESSMYMDDTFWSLVKLEKNCTKGKGDRTHGIFGLLFCFLSK